MDYDDEWPGDVAHNIVKSALEKEKIRKLNIPLSKALETYKKEELELFGQSYLEKLAAGAKETIVEDAYKLAKDNGNYSITVLPQRR